MKQKGQQELCRSTPDTCTFLNIKTIFLLSTSTYMFVYVYLAHEVCDTFLDVPVPERHATHTNVCTVPVMYVTRDTQDAVEHLW